ncbi:olfactory receptor 52K1-like [Gastrophryne carolinensis]
MLPDNHSVFYPEAFILEGLPGFEFAYGWISVPMFIMFMMAILGNSLIMILITTEDRLHSPMYYLIWILSLMDMIVSCTVVLKMLSIFWQDLKEITFLSCLIQMFFIHCFSSVESGILMAMALDRYMAICNPLHYTTVLTNTLIIKIVLALIIRGIIIVTPCPVMASRLPYCQTLHIAQFYCDHMAVVKLACTDTSVNSAYGLTVVVLVIVCDMSLITVSYFLILRAVLKLPSKTSKKKAFSTCTSHILIILMTYTLGLFAIVTYRIGHIALYSHIVLSNLYVLIPPALNPIIYGIKTKQIRMAAYNLFSPGLKLTGSFSNLK